MSAEHTCEACGEPLKARTRARGSARRFCDKPCRQKAHRASQRAKAPLGSTGPGVPHGPEARVRQAPGFGAGPGSGLGVSEGSGLSVSWSYAKFAAPAGQRHGAGRRATRIALRQLLNQVTEVERCKRCGRELLGGAAKVVVRAGTAHFSGVESCGRVWLCPVCAAKIRARRGDEIAEAVGRHLEAGGGAYFATATLPHDQGDALAASLDVLTKAWRDLTATGHYTQERKRFGILGNIAAREVTHGRNGWHPHIHAVILTRMEVDVLGLCDWFGRLDARWTRALQRHGWAPGKLGYRFRLDLVNRSTAAGLAAYVTKVQDGAGLGNEIARADLKTGRKSSRTPLQILADFGTDGLVSDLDLWHEYERATAGKSAIRWSRGLRALLLPDVEELTDEEVAAEEVGGDTVAYILPHTWYRLADIPGAQAAVLDAVEADGWEGLIKVLVGYRVGVDGVLAPEEWEG